MNNLPVPYENDRLPEPAYEFRYTPEEDAAFVALMAKARSDHVAIRNVMLILAGLFVIGAVGSVALGNGWPLTITGVIALAYEAKVFLVDYPRRKRQRR